MLGNVSLLSLWRIGFNLKKNNKVTWSYGVCLNLYLGLHWPVVQLCTPLFLFVLFLSKMPVAHLFVCLTFSFEMIITLREVAKIVERSLVLFTQFPPLVTSHITRVQQ